jgi:hypothetical protein
MDKYPVHSLKIPKNETELKNVDEILSYFKNKIVQHPIAAFISIFNHYEHTKSIDGDINPEIIDAKNILFCFGAAIPNSKMLAVRPRSIGVAEYEDFFMIEFLEAPKEDIQELLVLWSKELILK